MTPRLLTSAACCREVELKLRAWRAVPRTRTRRNELAMSRCLGAGDHVLATRSGAVGEQEPRADSLGSWKGGWGGVDNRLPEITHPLYPYRTPRRTWRRVGARKASMNQPRRHWASPRLDCGSSCFGLIQSKPRHGVAGRHRGHRPPRSSGAHQQPRLCGKP